MLISIVPLLIVAMLLGGLVLGIILWITGGSSRSGEMACGACGYPVRGLSVLNCPECGADLRVVGITKTKGKGSRTTGIVLTACCGGLLLFGCVFSILLFGLRPSVAQPVQSSPTPLQSTPSTTTDFIDEQEVVEPQE